MLYYLIYISKATHALSDDELLALLRQSRENNKIQGITGMLLYIQGNFLNVVNGHLAHCLSSRFIQVLEGTAEAVELMFERIGNDDRHYDLTVIKREVVGERSFETWDMGFKSVQLGDDKDIAAFFELNDTFTERGISVKRNIPLNYLRSFYMISKGKPEK